MNTSIVVVFITVLAFTRVGYCLNSVNCGSLIRSSCNDQETTFWNKTNITFHLKEWFRSINIIDRVLQTKESKEKYYLTKKVRKDFDFPRITYIGNFDCVEKKSKGPIWKTPPGTLIKKMQFHNGFLYGMEASDGKLTGKSKCICSFKHGLLI